MKFKSQIVTAVSGSIGGTTFARNAGGMYMRGRATPTNPQTSFQLAVRNAMNTLVNAWQGELSDTQRAAWKDYADNVPLVDVFGDARTRTGQQMYIRSNVPRLQAGLSRVDSAPADFNLGEFSTPTIEVDDGDPGQLSVAFDDTDAWVDEDDSAMLVYASRQVSPSINFFKGPYRFADKIEGDATTAPTSPALMNTKFSYTDNNKVFLKVAVTRADGRLSSPERLSAIITP